MQGNTNLLNFANTIESNSSHGFVGMSDCYKIGMWGGCGFDCCVFLRGECGESKEVCEDKIKIEDFNNGFNFKEKEEVRKIVKEKYNITI